MMKHVCLILCFIFSINGQTIIRGDEFKSFSDFIVEPGTRFNPKDVFAGSIVFVKTNCLNSFFIKDYPKIDHPFILVSHESDKPSPGKYKKYLNDQKLLAWFGQNPSIINHKKFFPIPIGIADEKWIHGNSETLTKIQSTDIDKTQLLYLNINVNTYPIERQKVFDMFTDKHYCLTASNRNFEEYLTDLKSSCFVLSPRGNGLDTHRTYESILMGAIPIVRTSELDSLFENLPVLIVQSWEMITEEFLLEKYEEISKKEYCLDKLYSSYWKEVLKKSLEL